MENLNDKQKQVIGLIVNRQLRNGIYWVVNKNNKNKICLDASISNATFYRYFNKFKELNILRPTNEENVYFVDSSNIR